MGVSGGAKLSKPNNLIFCYDAANPKSYSGSGTTVYDVIQNIAATVTNGATFSTNNAGYFDFDGSDDYFQVGDTPLVDNLTGDATWELLFKSDNRDNRCNIYNKSYHGTGTITNETSGSMTLYFGDGADASTNYYGSTGAGVHFNVDNVWHHYIVVRDFTNTQQRHYKNGTLLSTDTSFVSTNSEVITAAEAATHNITIGKGYAGHFNGQVALVKIYDTALTTAEVVQSFNNIRGRVGL